MYTELGIFAFFYAFAITAHAAKSRAEVREALREAGKSWRAHRQALATALLSPASWDAVQHYLIHLVVYSGKVFGTH